MTVHILLEIMCLDHKPISLSVCACSDRSSCYVYFTYRCSFPRLHGSYGNIPLLYLEQRVLGLIQACYDRLHTILWSTWIER